MNWIKNVAKTFGPRLLGIIAGFASTKLAEQHVTVDPATLIGIGTVVYAGVHKAVSAKVNPGDSATGRVADAISDAASGQTLRNTVVVAPKR